LDPASAPSLEDAWDGPLREASYAF